MNLYKTFVVPPLGPLGGMIVSRLKPNIAQTRLRFPSFVSDKALAVGSLPWEYRRLAPCRSFGLSSIGLKQLKPVLRTCLDIISTFYKYIAIWLVRSKTVFCRGIYV